MSELPEILKRCGLAWVVFYNRLLWFMPESRTKQCLNVGRCLILCLFDRVLAVSAFENLIATGSYDKTIKYVNHNHFG